MNSYLKAIGIGTVAGMRSMTAPALTADHFEKHPSLFLEASPLKGLGLPRTALVLKLLALGELGGDKLPKAPSRTAPIPLAGRAMSGGVCGAAVFYAEGDSPVIGAVLGAAAAVASAFLFMTLRSELGKATKLPDPVIAVAEDILTLGIGIRVFAGE